ncbi:hypothetical protein COB57_04255 [Candidatus Peregrinibacteria bacterium]|nr:MAG: hypothetical protein COB57_04255 [Candidatus Peregrinibacteria bacterium]
MKILSKNIGILSFLGGFEAHKKILQDFSVYTSFVKEVKDLESIDALIIPGGDNSVLLSLLSASLFPALQKRIAEGMPVFVTGSSVLLFTDPLSPLYIRQFHMKKSLSREEYQENIIINFSDMKPFSAHFIPFGKIESLEKNMKIFSRNTEGEAVLFQYKHILFSAFYPEFSTDYRIHEYFLNLI